MPGSRPVLQADDREQLDRVVAIVRLDVKEMGIGLAAAVLIDATIVRAVLLPATMKLLGERNWYLPSWLEWLPRLDHGEAPPHQAEPRADAESLPAAA